MCLLLCVQSFICEMRLYGLFSKMRCRQVQATRINWFNVVTLNICYFHIFKISVKTREEMCQKLCTSVALQWCHTI